MKRMALLPFLPFLLCGALLFAAAPTHGMGVVAFVGLIPLLFGVRKLSSYRSAAMGGLLAGLAFFLPGIAWLIPVTILGWIALSLYCAVYFAAFAAAVYWSSRLTGTLNVLFVAAAWTLLEFVRGIAFTGFPWLFLSHSQYGFSTFVQSLDLLGALGLGGIIAAVNVLLYQSIFGNPKAKQLRSLMGALSIVAILCAYGSVRTRTIVLRPSLHVGAVQAAVPQEMKETLEGDYDPEGVLARYVKQTEALPREKFDLIVWPETIFLSPYTLNVDPAALKDYYSKYATLAQTTLASIAREREAYVLTGASTYLPADLGYVADPESAARIPSGAWTQRYNSAMLFDANGKYVDRYDKMHLVPFGEYIPLPNTFPFLAKLVPFDESLIAGQRSTIFTIPGSRGPARFGVLICYEDADADLARRLRQTGADFIVNLSNDAWFGASELDQHFVVARFRAIENRVGVLRNGNNGITGIIDPMGRVQNQLGQMIDGKFVMRDVMGHLEGQLWITDARSLYSYTGDTPVIVVCSLIVLLCVFRKKNDRSRSQIPLQG